MILENNKTDRILIKAKSKPVIIPEDNQPDLSEVDQVVRENTRFISARHLDTVIGNALTADPAAAR